MFQPAQTVNVIFNILCRNLFPLGNLQKTSMDVSSAFGFLYGLAALWTYGRDIFEEERVVSEDATALLTEEEMQRRQLLVFGSGQEHEREIAYPENYA